jgi:hypothetical protein
VSSAHVVGTDIFHPGARRAARMFAQADITALPFSSGAFPAVAAIDVLEHLPAAIRDRAISEMVRVARGIAVIAFPSGRQAEEADRAFHHSLSRRGKTSPGWLLQHLEESYPSADAIVNVLVAAAAEQRRQVDTAVVYSEHIRVTRLIRWAAARSVLLFFAVDVLAGLWAALVRPSSGATNSYRAIVVARFR